MDFILPLPKCTISLLSTNQSTKVEKSLFRCPFAVVNYYAGKPDKYHWHIMKAHYLQLVACR